MRTAALPQNEGERLAELESYDIVDTIPEQAYDAITYLAAQICDVPIALISIVDADRQWFKSRVGLDVEETSRDLAFCADAIVDPRSLMVVPDATKDVRFADNPLVTGDPSIRFYAGAPLVTAAGNALGTICVIDREPRQLTDDQEKALAALAVQVMALLELRRTIRALEAKDLALVEATSERDRLMAMVSHEIRTPLTAVVGFVELLRDSESGLTEADRAEVLESVSRQAGDVEALIEDLMVTSRAEAGSLAVASVAVGLPAQVYQVLEGLSASKGQIELDLNPARATGDPARVRQIIRNLITNARRYGGPEAKVRTFTEGDLAHLQVLDNGTGIPEGDRERVFEAFGQSQAARAVADSVGLGLPISRLLAERMGGSLVYRYSEGMSVFELTLPARG